MNLQLRSCALALALALAGLYGCASSPEATRDKYLQRGKEFLAKKEYARAALEFRNAAKAVPKDAEPYYQMGLTASAAGDLPGAVSAYRKAVDLNPKHVGARLKLSELMALTGDPGLLKQAEDTLLTLLESTDRDPDMLNALAFTELKLGKTDEAMRNLEQALVLAPQAVSSSMMLAHVKLAQKDVKGAEEVLKRACATSPKTALPRLILGRFYLTQKQPEAAEAEFRRALELNPNSEAALMQLGVLQSASGRKSEAEQTFRRAASLGNRNYKHVYAVFLFQEGRRAEALQEFERLAKEAPEDRAARTRLVAAYHMANRTAAAEKILADALRKNPKDLDALLERAELSLRAGKYGPAEADLNRVLQLRPDSAEVHFILAKLYQARSAELTYRQELAKALSLNPFLLPVRLELAQALISRNNAKAALDILNEAPQSQKELPPVLVQRNWAYWALGDMAQLRKGIDQGLARERTTDLLIQDGLWKVRSGNFAAGRVALEEALRLNPADLRALAALKDTYVVEKKPSVALQKVKEYAARQPRSAPVQEFLGLMLVANGERQQARAAFAAAKTIEPQYTRADLSMVQLDALESKWDAAYSRLNDLLARNPGNTTARLWLGNIEVLRGNHKAAMEQFHQVVQADPDNPQALNNYAYALVEVGQKPDEALKYAERAVELAPSQAALADTLGWILYRKGVYAAAVRHLERAAAEPDGDPVSKYHLAMAYAKAGDPKRGRATLEAALKLNPHLPEAKMAQQVLQPEK